METQENSSEQEKNNDMETTYGEVENLSLDPDDILEVIEVNGTDFLFASKDNNNNNNKLNL